MPTWAWILLALLAIGFGVRLLQGGKGPEATERLEQALAILLIVAVIVGLLLAFVLADWQ